MITSSFPVTSGSKFTGSDFHGVFRTQNFLLINLPQKVFWYLSPFSRKNCQTSPPFKKNGPKLFLISICSIRILNILEFVSKTIISKISKGATLISERIITDQTSSLNEYLIDKGFNVTALDQNQVYRWVGNLRFEDILSSRMNSTGAYRASLQFRFLPTFRLFMFHQNSFQKSRYL